MEYDPITVAETGQFQRKVGRLLTENEKSNISLDEKNALSKAIKELVKVWS